MAAIDFMAVITLSLVCVFPGCIGGSRLFCFYSPHFIFVCGSKRRLRTTDALVDVDPDGGSKESTHFVRHLSFIVQDIRGHKYLCHYRRKKQEEKGGSDNLHYAIKIVYRMPNSNDLSSLYWVELQDIGNNLNRWLLWERLSSLFAICFWLLCCSIGLLMAYVFDSSDTIPYIIILSTVLTLVSNVLIELCQKNGSDCCMCADERKIGYNSNYSNKEPATRTQQRCFLNTLIMYKRPHLFKIDHRKNFNFEKRLKQWEHINNKKNSNKKKKNRYRYSYDTKNSRFIVNPRYVQNTRTHNNINSSRQWVYFETDNNKFVIVPSITNKHMRASKGKLKTGSCDYHDHVTYTDIDHNNDGDKISIRIDNNDTACRDSVHDQSRAAVIFEEKEEKKRQFSPSDNDNDGIPLLIDNYDNNYCSDRFQSRAQAIVEEREEKKRDVSPRDETSILIDEYDNCGGKFGSRAAVIIEEEEEQPKKRDFSPSDHDNEESLLLIDHGH